MKLKHLLLLPVVFAQAPVYGQRDSYECLFVKKDSAVWHVAHYAGLIHQHQDFFTRPFSFQGAEGGLVFNHRVLLGLYGAMFASPLEARLRQKTVFLNIAQAGMVVGYTPNNRKYLHAGYALSLGYFSLKASERKIPISARGAALSRLHGLVLSPQVFAEANLLQWLSFRPGMCYNYYSFEEEDGITHAGMNNIALNFGFMARRPTRGQQQDER